MQKVSLLYRKPKNKMHLIKQTTIFGFNCLKKQDAFNKTNNNFWF